MGIISRLFQPQASADTDEMLRKMISGGYGVTSSGTTVSPQTAMCVSAFFACILVISQTVGKIPLILYRKTDKGEVPATDHPLSYLVGTKPNSFNNSQSFREMLTAHTCMRGNSFAFINRLRSGEIAELIPLESNAVGIYRDPRTWKVTYQINQKEGINGLFTPDKVFHLMDMTLDGYKGINRIAYARETIGLTAAAEKYGAVTFKNGAKSSGVYNSKKRLDDTAFDRLKESLNYGFSGANAHKAMIVEGEDTWTPSQMSNIDVQYMEIMQYQVPQIARFYNMPLHKIQDMSASTNNNIEHQGREFYTDCMMPWFTRWESGLNTQLLSEKDQKTYFWKHDVDEIMRADMKSRFEAYASGISSEILNPNECRGWENLGPYDGGEKYLNRNTKPAPHTGEGKQNAK